MITDPVRKLFVLVFVLSIGLGYSRGWATLLARNAGIDLVYIGLMETVAIAVALGLRYPIGILIDHLGAKPFILGGCMLSGVACILYLARIGPSSFLAGSAIENISLLIIHISLFSAALTLVREHQKGLFFSRYNIADQSGGVILPLVAGFLAACFSLELLFIIDLIASFILLILFALLFPTSKQKINKSLKFTLSKFFDFREAQKHILVLLVSIEILLGAATGLFSPYLAVYAHEYLGMEYSGVGTVFSLSLIAFIFGSYKLGRKIDAWGPLKSWIISSIAYSLLLIGLGFCKSIWVFIITYCLTQVAQSVQIPAYQSILPFILPGGREGQIAGLAGNAMKISTLLVTPLGAVVWKQFGASLIFVLAGVLMFLSTVPCWLFLRYGSEGELIR